MVTCISILSEIAELSSSNKGVIFLTKTILFYVYFTSILMLSHLFLYYFILSDLHLLLFYLIGKIEPRGLKILNLFTTAMKNPSLKSYLG